MYAYKYINEVIKRPIFKETNLKVHYMEVGLMDFLK